MKVYGELVCVTITLAQNYIILLGSVLLNPILANAGRDISHWFNKTTEDVSYEHTVEP